VVPSARILELALRVFLGNNIRNNFLRIIRDYDRSDDDNRSDDDDRDNYHEDDDVSIGLEYSRHLEVNIISDSASCNAVIIILSK